MKISTFNSMGCYDLIIQIALPLPLVMKRIDECKIILDNNFLVWENQGHRIEEFPNYLGTLIRVSITNSRTETFAKFITDVAMAEDNFIPEDCPEIKPNAGN